MNEKIATGHVMRCLSVADALRSRGTEVMFVCADDDPVSLINERGFEAHVLGTDWQDMNSELPALKSFLTKVNAKLLLVDSYQVNADYFSDLRKVIKTAYIDDMNAVTYDLDMLISYGIYADDGVIKNMYPDSVCLTGPAYAPLNKAYLECAPKVIREKAENILILSGGSDPAGAIKKLLAKCTALDLKDIHVIMGRYHKDRVELINTYASDSRVRIDEPVPGLKEHICKADIVLTAGGSTMYEICACGTPAVSYSLADNQNGNVHGFEKEGLIPFAGAIEDPHMPDKAAELIAKLIDDNKSRKSISEKMQNRVDGKGAGRIAEAMISLIEA
jgi:UDP-2,4-diacetamido-2,4,6-trideoxy-beta-L-altropyranose hydrolase